MQKYTVLPFSTKAIITYAFLVQATYNLEMEADRRRPEDAGGPNGGSTSHPSSKELRAADKPFPTFIFMTTLPTWQLYGWDLLLLVRNTKHYSNNGSLGPSMAIDYDGYTECTRSKNVVKKSCCKRSPKVLGILLGIKNQWEKTWCIVQWALCCLYLQLVWLTGKVTTLCVGVAWCKQSTTRSVPLEGKDGMEDGWEWLTGLPSSRMRCSVLHNDTYWYIHA